jgi:hypothetical protein
MPNDNQIPNKKQIDKVNKTQIIKSLS